MPTHERETAARPTYGDDGTFSFIDRYRTHVQVQPSSVDADPGLWIFFTGGVSGNYGTIHLELGHAVDLISGLARTIYLNDSKGVYAEGRAEQVLNTIAMAAYWVKNNTTQSGTGETCPQATYDDSGETFGFTDLDGANVWVKPSTLATEAAHWIFVANNDRSNDGATHLGVDHAMELIAGLAWVMSNKLGSEDEQTKNELRDIAYKARWVRDNTAWGDDLHDLDGDDEDEEY